MLDDVPHLNPETADDGPDHVADDWPVAPTSPPIMIPALRADGSQYPVEKIEAHVRGLHHLALSVFLFSGNELLIQRRAESKYHCGGQWANTCCTHPHFGEDHTPAAHRRLMEELGCQADLVERRVVDYSADVGGGLWERERVHMFRGDVDKSTFKLALNPEEVAETRWVDAEALHTDIRANPANYTPWFRLYVNRYPALDF
ncbi:MAG: NUDIX domain-containing protein [Pseudomonadota bacterium]